MTNHRDPESIERLSVHLKVKASALKTFHITRRVLLTSVSVVANVNEAAVVRTLLSDVQKLQSRISDLNASL